MWDFFTHDLAENNPIIARDILDRCSYSDIAKAICIKKRGQEGVGYKIEYRK